MYPDFSLKLKPKGLYIKGKICLLQIFQKTYVVTYNVGLTKNYKWKNCSLIYYTSIIVGFTIILVYNRLTSSLF